MITATSLTIDIGSRRLLDDATFKVVAGDRAGLVGRNGSGKSTLVSVLVGAASPAVRTLGRVEVTGSVAHLPQVPVPGGLGAEPHGLSHALSARGLDALDDDLVAARRAMAADPSDAAIAHFSELEQRYRDAGGYQAESVIARLADGLGLDEELLVGPIDDLSGGQRRRLDLLRALFAQPDVLVLDEPTNHLDRSATAWLMAELARYPGALLVISHDLHLLDEAVTKVLHLEGGHLDEFRGNYTSFRAQLAAERSRRARAAAREEAEIRRLSSLADSMRAQTERRARTAKVLDRRVARLEGGRTRTLQAETGVRFRLPDPPRGGAEPLRVEGLAVSYDGGPPVLAGLDLSLGRGDRLAVVGRNGAGKSSLLRCLAGAQAPNAGRVAHGHGVVVGYFAQEHEQVDYSRTVLDNIDDAAIPGLAERRALLGSFGLAGDVAHQRPASLSGGERAKLALAMLASGRCNLLVLDEPTNNLDPASVVAVGDMLSRWPGTLVAVSHDRSFVAALHPTHALHLPSQRLDLWRDTDLDEVALT